MKKILKKILYFFFRDNLYVIQHQLKYHINRITIIKKARKYNKHKPFIIDHITHKEKIRILFFVYDLNMWRYEGLMKLLLLHPRFEPIMIPFVMPEKDTEANKSNRDKIIAYCNANDFPARDGYDFDSGRYLDIKDINPDIVIYPQPYGRGHQEWNIDSYTEKCLFIYTPYGISTSKSRALKDTYLTNIAWKIFVSCQLEKKVYDDNISTRSTHVVVTGTSIPDDLQKADIQKSPWRNPNKKRIIWAPHHSIDSQRGFANSNFERICDEMLELAKRYQDDIEIAFKPHPALRERLIVKWGREKTEFYYGQWAARPNTILCLGGYTELFAFSDAMIHDCASFAFEYLFTGKPVMFLCNNPKLYPPAGIGNDLGTACFRHHYAGYSIKDIETFVNDIVMSGYDSMKNQRVSFVKNQLLPPNNQSASENMLNELTALFKKQ